MENVYRVCISLVVSAFMLLMYNEFIAKQSYGAAAVGDGSFVTFNPIKFFNSQRAYMSSTIGKDGKLESDAALSIRELANISERSRAVIREIAGGAIVIIQQSVMLNDNVIDITDEVLEQLGLPVNVPGTYGLDTTSEKLMQFGDDTSLLPNFMKIKPLSEQQYEERRNADHAKQYLP